MRIVWIPLLIGSLLFSSLAFAQQQPLTGNAPPTAGQPTTVPPPPKTNDPMLLPVTPATRTISSWNDALAYIRARSTDLRIAFLEVKRAEAQSREALAGVLPSLNGTTSFSHNLIVKENSSTTIPGGFGSCPPGPACTTVNQPTPLPNLASASLVAALPLIAPRAWNAIRSAHLNEDVNKLSVDDTKRNIALNVANAIVSVVTAERVAELNRIGLRSSLERFELTQRKKNLGAATGLDVVRVQQDVENARATLVNGDESLRQARESLGLALGVPEAVGVAAGVDLNGIAASTLASCTPTPNLDDRPDIAAARKRIAFVHSSTVADAETLFSPVVTAQSTLGDNFFVYTGSPPTAWNIQAVLTWNIWDGGTRYGLLRDGRAQEEEARQRLEAAKRSAQIQVDQAKRSVDVSEQSRKVAENARALAAQVDKLTQAGYLEGQGTSLDLVIAAESLRQAEINLALQEFGLVKAKLAAMLTLATCPM